MKHIRTSVVKIPGKTLIFVKKFWNHRTEERSLGVLMGDVKAETQ